MTEVAHQFPEVGLKQLHRSAMNIPRCIQAVLGQRVRDAQKVSA